MMCTYVGTTSCRRLTRGQVLVGADRHDVELRPGAAGRSTLSPVLPSHLGSSFVARKPTTSFA